MHIFVTSANNVSFCPDTDAKDGRQTTLSRTPFKWERELKDAVPLTKGLLWYISNADINKCLFVGQEIGL